MNNHIPTISPATRSAVRDHIIESEKRVDWPYLDIKGNVTIGVGFKTKNENDFAKLDLQVFKDGKWVEATDTEKRQAYQKMQKAKEKRGGDFNFKAGKDKGTTEIRMTPESQDAELDKKISKNIENIKKSVGEDAWDKLNDAQKAAVTDIVHANGPIEGFPNLKDAIQAGDAKKMADESTFFTDREKGLRDKERLQRNYKALSGLNKEEAKKGLDEALTKNSPIRNATPPAKPGEAGGTSGSDDDLENASPEARAFMKDLFEPGKPIDEIMMKRPEDLTEGEAREIMIARMNAKTHDERERLFKAEKGFFDHFFGNQPIEPDAAGRTMEPQPIRPIPQTPTPVSTADGEPLGKGLRRIGRMVVRDARDDGLASVIKHLQGGLNILGEAKAPKDGAAILPKLKEDGVFGPKSRSGLKRAVASLGTPKVEEGLALGRFNAFARDGRKEGFGRLKEVTEGSFGLLFRNPAKTTRRPSKRLEAVTLQEALNDLGAAHFGRDTFKPLGLDGDIGPKTTDAFSQLAAALGHERLTKRFGEFLGFF